MLANDVSAANGPNGIPGGLRKVRKGLWKDLVSEEDNPLTIKAIDFSIMTPEEIVRASQMQVVTPDLYQETVNEERTAMPGGPLDSRLGAIDKASLCATCGLQLADCPGHFGYVKLALPVFHCGFLDMLLKVLQIVCKSCSRVLLEPEEKKRFSQRLQSLNCSANMKVRHVILKEIVQRCARVKFCPSCDAPNGVVKKVGVFRIVHYPDGNVPKTKRGAAKMDTDDPGSPSNIADVDFHFQAAVKANPDLEKHISKCADDLDPVRAMSILDEIPPEDMKMFNMLPSLSSPSSFIIQALPIPPLCVRPTVCSSPSMGSTEDDLTVQARVIMSYNRLISLHTLKGSPTPTIADIWERLQTEVTRYMYAEFPRLEPPRDQFSDKPLRGIADRFKGKPGRFRQNLCGKRVDFSARTVISPDPNLRVDQVGMPVLIAKILTYPERVTRYNIRRLRAAVIRGTQVHPGANFVEIDGHRKLLKYTNRREIAASLRPGSLVERHLIDGDVVLFNRQPSLHRISIMCHRVKVLPHRTFRFNECVCGPYNADFDGDEMNIQVPQTEEARAEALELMGVPKNLATPGNGELLVKATQDFLTASFKMTSKDYFLDRAEFSEALCMMTDASSRLDIPLASIIKPVEMWTGKQLISSLVAIAIRQTLPECEHLKKGSFSSESRESSFSLGRQAGTQYPSHMCPSDGYVCFRGGELICGQVGKKSLGGSKHGALFALTREIGPEAAAKVLNCLAKFSARWLGTVGFSIGVDDVTPSEELVDIKAGLVRMSYRRCKNYIEEYKNGTLNRQPGFSLEDSLEARLKADLSKIREDAGHACITQMNPKINAALCMTLCGSKGSSINIAQMANCVGQQIVNGSRVPDGFFGRALPHFETGAKAKRPDAKGFVSNSFRSGLTCTEFFFHAMSGREGLVDTAVKTADLGYLQRKLMKSLETLCVQYDRTVRMTGGKLVQMHYGEDGFDPYEMEDNDGKAINFRRTMTDSVVATAGRGESFLNVKELKTRVGASLASLGKDLELRGSREERLDKVLKDAKSYMLDLANNQESMIRVLRKCSDSSNNADEELCNVSYGYRNAHIEEFARRIAHKLRKAEVEPGTAVGSIGAQSIGEPATQMTLKTFHFAGVAAMSVTQGVPRIKEILGANASISTPIITAPLVSNKQEKSARIVRGRIECTKLEEVAQYIKEVYRANNAYIAIGIDLDLIDRAQLDTDIDKVADSIICHSKLKVSPADLAIIRPNKIRIYPREKSSRKDAPEKLGSHLFYRMQDLKLRLPQVVVAGAASARRVVISETKCKDTGDKALELHVEGEDIAAVMAVPGVLGEKVKCNHIAAVARTMGIEAARKTIIDEIMGTTSQFGISIDIRHLMLLADYMTYPGGLIPITRAGVAKTQSSPFMLASFEEPLQHLMNGAIHSQHDELEGPSECIIMGLPVRLGTNVFSVLRSKKSVDVSTAPRRREILFKSSLPKHVRL